MWNTSFYAIMTEIGVLISCTLVAFGFSRFRFPGRDFLFIVLISTIFLPARSPSSPPTLSSKNRTGSAPGCL
jgi:ABC-type glycerol-3-phosphate transport system permease component